MSNAPNIHPKILHIETGMHLYGGAKQVYYLLKGLKQEGFGENVLVCARGSEVYDECKGVCKIYSPKISGDLDLSFLFKLIKIIKKEHPDILHIHSRRGADIWGLIGAKLTNTKCIITRRVDNPENKLIARIKYSLFDEIVSISNGIKMVLSSEGINKGKIRVIPSAVDFDFYNKVCDKDWFSKEFNISPGWAKIGMIAQFIPRKGHRFLVEAVPEILKKHPNTLFLLLGKGPLIGEIKGLIEKNNIRKNIKLLGFRNDIEKILPCLDILVHPAFMEGLGVSLIQASAAGVPIVASSVGGIPEVVRHQQNGLLFPTGDRTTFIKHILRLLEDTDLAHKLGQNGKHVAKKYFSIENMTKEYITIYKQMIN